MEKRKSDRKPSKPRAKTEDILGKRPRRERIAAKWQKQYAHLTELRNYFANRQADLTKDALEENPSFSTHQADAGTDSYDRDLALGMLSSKQDALYEVEEALERIRSGTYGICEITGKPIEAARLEAIPWTRFSAAVERQLESEGAIKQTRLGPRETVGERTGGEGSGT